MKNPSWLSTMVARASTFLFLFSILVLSLFLLGNFQNFLDSTQIDLLRIFETSSLLYVAIALYYVGLRVVLAVRRRQRWRSLSIGAAVAGAVFLFTLYLVFGFLIVWLKPVH